MASPLRSSSHLFHGNSDAAKKPQLDELSSASSDSLREGFDDAEDPGVAQKAQSDEVSSVSTRSSRQELHGRKKPQFDELSSASSREDSDDSSKPQLDFDQVSSVSSDSLRDMPMELGCPDGSMGGFYGLMRDARDLRREIVHCLLDDDGDDNSSSRAFVQDDLQFRLEGILASLQAIPRPAGWQLGDDDHMHSLVADVTTHAQVRLEYEKSELIRDVCFISGGNKELLAILQGQHVARIASGAKWVEPDLPTWTESVGRALVAMRAATAASSATRIPARFRNFITDRDGTINNYCDRYASSVQSAYNAIWVSRFTRQSVDNAILISAAPLGGRLGSEGMMELCTMPRSAITCAGSKGREYFDHAKNQIVQVEALPSQMCELLAELHCRLVALCLKPGNSKFLGLGSGLQCKFGEVTMARNDPSGNVPEEESHRFMAEVRDIMKQVDPMGDVLDMHDTGIDMEIFPRMADGHPSFNKGKGVTCLDHLLGLQIAEGPNLVCGDTFSDIPMVEAVLSLMGTSKPANNLAVLFVVTPEQHARTPGLADRVRTLCEHGGARYAILPSSDVLVTALSTYAGEVGQAAHPRSRV